MPTLLLILVVGAAAGFLATRFMRVQADVPTTIAIGVGGVFMGWLVLRFLTFVSGALAMFVGAVLGAALLIWLWRTYVER